MFFKNCVFIVFLSWTTYTATDPANPAQCAFNPCYNGGRCVLQPGDYHCVCAEGFSGIVCQDITSTTTPSTTTTEPCTDQLPNCQDYVTSYAAGRTGGFCETSTSTAQQLCARTCGFCGGTTTTTQSTTQTTTTPIPTPTQTPTPTPKTSPTTTVPAPTTPAPVQCAVNPCSNGGVCYKVGGLFSCVCPAGFSGVVCQNGQHTPTTTTQKPTTTTTTTTTTTKTSTSPTTTTATPSPTTQSRSTTTPGTGGSTTQPISVTTSMKCASCLYDPSHESCHDSSTTCSGSTPLCMTSYLHSKFNHTLQKRCASVSECSDLWWTKTWANPKCMSRDLSQDPLTWSADVIDECHWCCETRGQDWCNHREYPTPPDRYSIVNMTQYILAHQPSTPATTATSTKASTTSPATASSLTTSPWPANSPCNSRVYDEINDPKRLTDNIHYNYALPVLSDFKLQRGWKRFTSGSGMMPTSCQPQNTCGTIVPGWMKGTHPTVAEGTVQRAACFNFDGPNSRSPCCEMEAMMFVQNCGGYYVYGLMASPTDTAAYCVEASNSLVG